MEPGKKIATITLLTYPENEPEGEEAVSIVLQALRSFGYRLELTGSSGEGTSSSVSYDVFPVPARAAAP